MVTIMQRLECYYYQPCKRTLFLFVEVEEHSYLRFYGLSGLTYYYACRCLICTNAFGIGVEIPDVDLVIHWGAPESILAYWQEVGRCARDGRNGEAHLLATKRSLITRPDSGPSKEIVELCNIVADGPCLRQKILSNLFVDGMEPFCPPASCAVLQQEHIENGCTCSACLCCSTCRVKCPCRA